jgi:hypothetical protein
MLFFKGLRLKLFSSCSFESLNPKEEWLLFFPLVHLLLFTVLSRSLVDIVFFCLVSRLWDSFIPSAYILFFFLAADFSLP